ncbi:MAG: 6-phosphofructokinase [Clostridia bacterium]|nr:6-phosphofructokinase [Clostridia bacterium]
MGNAIVGQSGGPTAAINATLAGVIKGALECDAINTLYGMRNGIEGMLGERMIDLSKRFDGGNDLDALIHTPAAALGSCRKKLPNPESDKAEDIAFFEKVFEIFEKYDIRYFFYIGGNDSMDTVAKLSRYAEKKSYEIRVMGVPKTIDNDLVATDHTPGFGSAAKFVSTVITEIVRDCAVYTTKAVTIVEVMGRDAGWLTASAGIGKYVGIDAPDLVYLPERDFSMDEFFSSLEKAFEKHPNIVVAVSEGIRFADGRYVGEGTQSGSTDVFGHKYLAGTAKALELAVKEKFGCKVRSIELNLPQRCASHLASKTDLDESVAVGAYAVERAADGESGEMVLFLRVSEKPYEVKLGAKKVSEIANAVRKVPDEYINAEGNHITAACADYILPLIAGEAYPEYENGLPKYIVL